MEQYPILSRVDYPSDIRSMDYQTLNQLCAEIRDFMIANVSQTGGHLASNLGTVELTVALHRVFHTPEDTLVWDVGHQCYTHKILTGRKDGFRSLRQPGGLAGFPKPSESVYDSFTVGHSSTSISLAYGVACANQLAGNDLCTAAIIGDGAFTGGMAYEAMNNAGRSKTNLVIILNHNSMSISRNVGAFARYLAVIRAKPAYLRLKERTELVLDHIPLIGSRMKEALRSSKSLLKYLLYHSTFFEDMGFVYFGPVDGHDLPALEQTLERARDLRRPAFVFVETVKGKGYEFAEKNPMAYHGISRFNVETGNPDIPPEDSFSNAFGRALCSLAEKDGKICGITAAMKEGTGLAGFAEKYSGRFYDVGIAEQHSVTFAVGLAAKGFRPVFAVYATFLQRAYDQILHDAAIDRRHIILAIDRAGLVGDDGETHQGIYDIPFLTTIPGITIFSPATYGEMASCLSRALYHTEGVVALRYPRGPEPDGAEELPDPEDPDFSWSPGSPQLTAVSYGRIAVSLWQAVNRLPEPPGYARCIQVFPFPSGLIDRLLSCRRIVFFEEAAAVGSISEHLLAILNARGYQGSFRAVTLPNAFIRQGKVREMLQAYRLDRDSMEEILREEWSK